MRPVTWIHVAGCAVGLACPSCADALGLHDLAEGSDGGDEAAGMSFVPLDARPREASPPGPKAPGSIPSDAMPMTVGEAAESGAPGSVMAPQAGPGPERPTTDAAPHLDSGVPYESDAAPPLDSAAAPTEAGAKGGACGASGPTMHTNGVGQTFQDCAPSGTHNATQALEACAAFTGKSASCTIASCAASGDGVGPTASDQAACSTGSSVCNCWTFSGASAGLVQSTNAKRCRPCAGGGRSWN